MYKKYTSLLIVIIIIAIIGLIFFRMMPSDYSKGDIPLSDFSTERALKHVEFVSKEQHYVGSSYHKNVLNYLDEELRKLGLETQIQEGNILSKWNNLVETKNLVTRIKGYDNSKALLLLTHYDSAPHSKSYGASDDANGLGVILEGIRVFLHNKTPHKNDIIIVFSDAEELGLNGAYAFASENPWAENIGLVLNFEARGTNGSSIMLAETNYGNAELIKGFAKANPKYPVSNSLMYSIYKMLPNDTDLTAFRETKDIPGFNFAYIDDHFDYHTVQDNFENFTPECLEHQATYLMPLLDYFSNADLSNLRTDNDHVYFNVPFGFIHYPFGWNLPLLIGGIILFFFVIFIGIGNYTLNIKEILKGFLPLILSLIVCGAVSFFGWKFVSDIYPEYQDMLHGFTYNGHSYMAAFVMLSVAICFWLYARFSKDGLSVSYFVAPLFLWLVINTLIYLYLPGASFFIIPIYFGIFILGIYVYSGRINPFFSILISVPALFIFVPFIYLFPVGLGLKMLAGSAILVVLTFVLLIPVFQKFENKSGWGLLFLLISCGFFIKAHANSNFEKGKGKPNSLLYVYDADENNTFWATYDKVLDPWTKNYLGEHPEENKNLISNVLQSKYNSGFSYTAEAPKKDIEVPTFNFLRDTIINDYRNISVEIVTNRNVNRLDIFAHENMKIHNLKANGVSPINQVGSLFKRNHKQVLNYYPVGNKSLTLSFQMQKDIPFDMEVFVSSFDLLENPHFSIPKRPDEFIPMPFVLNDAVVVMKKITQPNKISVNKLPDTTVSDTLTQL
ncbi:MAG: M28 family peptidase [Flavobacteriaceae bacterium]|jgi:hypothetical protein|nr:M28 family peptidase [Flavobacteriaceae bacterium]